MKGEGFMSLRGYQFDKCLVDARADASLYSNLNSNWNYVLPNRGNRMEITSNGLNITVDTGQVLIMGRLVEITEPMTIPIPPNSTGYVVIEVDLNKINTSTGTGDSYQVINNQLSLKFVNTIIANDLNNGGTLHQQALCSVTSTATNATFTKKLATYMSNRIDNFLTNVNGESIIFNVVIGYGVQCNFVRWGQWVYADIQYKVYTIPALTAGSFMILAETVPLGYRPQKPISWLGTTRTSNVGGNILSIQFTETGAISWMSPIGDPGGSRHFEFSPLMYLTNDLKV